VIKDYDFGRVNFLVDGFNNQLSDIDFYHATIQAISSANFIPDVTLPRYFGKNPFIRRVQSMIPQTAVNFFVESVAYIQKEINNVSRPLNYNGNIMPFLDTLKNQLVGRAQYPHPYFIENGIHSITLETHGNRKSTQTDKERVENLIFVMEKLVRIHDQLDE